MSYNTAQKVTGTLAAMVEAWNNWLANKRAEQLQEIKLRMEQSDRERSQANADRAYGLDRDQFNLQRALFNMKPYEEGRKALLEEDKAKRDYKYRLGEIAAQGAENRKTQGFIADRGGRNYVTPGGLTQHQTVADLLTILDREYKNALNAEAITDPKTGDLVRNPLGVQTRYWEGDASVRTPGQATPADSASTLLGQLLGFGRMGDNGTAKMTAEESDIANQVIKLKSADKKIGWDAMMKDHPNYNWALIKQAAGE